MARRRKDGWRVLLCRITPIVATASATPTVAFPFNSQVPTVARVGQDYSFQFCQSTFAPDDTNYTYSLSDQPGWLSLDSATRTLLGAPSQADAGASVFTLTAADSDGAAHMPCTLVVSTDPPPQIEGDISEQLAASANLSSSQPPIVTLLPSTGFRFQFQRNSFIDIVRRKLYYYATLTDHTPLPSWLQFDPQSLTFSGIVPELSAFPQSWDIDLIASDVEGFAGAATSFTIAIGTEQLVFVPEVQQINVTTGIPVNFTGLQSTLFSNGNLVAPSALVSVQALSLPTWLTFNPMTLAMTGTAPATVSDQNVTVTVKDKLGNIASVVILLVGGNSSFFKKSIGTLTAFAGKPFDYHFSGTLFAESDLDLMVDLPASATWLHFNSGTRELIGNVPTQVNHSPLQATLIAKSSDPPTVQTQVFEIDIRASTQTSTQSSDSGTQTSQSTATASPGLVAGQTQSHKHLSGGVIAAIVIASLAAFVFLVVWLILCSRRRKRESYVEDGSPPKRIISRPIPPLDPDSITVTTEVERNVEKNDEMSSRGGEAEEIEQAPQIALDIAQNPSKRLKWSKRFSRISHVSSLGNGEDAIRADSNIPEWGRQSAALHTPHDSFSVPAEIARSSRHLSDLSPSKRALKRLRDKRQSRSSVGLGINTGGAGLLPRHSSRRPRSHRRAVSSLGLSAPMDRSRSSIASLSTRGTSVLSMRPSEFPRPPTRSTFTGNRSMAAMSLSEAQKRKSVRLVDRSDSVADDRSMQEKRQSFIRNRASAAYASPMFAHGSKVSVSEGKNGRRSMVPSSAASFRRSQRGRSQLTTYSESSSLEPAAGDPRRFSERIRSAFAPSFPRAITKSTMEADDEDDDASDFYTTSSSISETDLAAELALPRHQRSWVLPGEASPTPPPAPPASREASSARRTPSSGGPQQRWKERLREHSSSPLATAVTVPLTHHPPSGGDTIKPARRNRLSEPISLVSNDSLSRAKSQRPRLVQTNSKRPVSVDKPQRLSSLKTEAESDDTRPGSEMWEAMQGAGLMPPSSGEEQVGTQGSNLSGPAFL